jgi:hypothetical protein
MASEQIRHAQTPDGDWVYVPSPTGTHITLPLDANALDNMSVIIATDAMKEHVQLFDDRKRLVQEILTRYAAHVAEVRDGE